MIKKTAICLFFALMLVVPGRSAAGLGKSLRAVAGSDTVCNVWVFFRERAAHGDFEPVSDRTALRRSRAGFGDGGSGRPVDRGHIAEIERRGGRLRHVFPWENAASFSMHASLLDGIASLPFVKFVAPVAVYVRRDAGGAGLGRAAFAGSYEGYGWHLDMVNVPLAHEYLRTRGLGEPGNGVVAAFFDTGFRLTHKALSRAAGGSVVSTCDFVDGKVSVQDPDSVNSNSEHGYWRNDRHGTQCLALVAGYQPGSYMGAAWGARFALARTENIGIEARVEEDNWAAAVVWAELAGADIISSSLGYRDGFSDPAEDYEYGDMDGATTVISRAAAGAVARGVIVVNSMGNENNHVWGTLVAPADVNGVVSVGAVDRYRDLASFSSAGPASDGRVKPEVAAPGVSVPLVDPYFAGLASYAVGSGTSFSAPIVAGIMALILQAHPGISAEEARKRLYASCVFAPRQTAVDNYYGHGIPDALRAVMGDSEVFLKLADNTGKPLQGARIKAGAETFIADGYGCAVARINPAALPAELKIIYRGEILRSLTVSSLPLADSLTFEVKRDEGLKIHPNLIKRNGVFKGRYYFSPSETVPKNATATIRAIDGKTVWNQKLRLLPDGSAVFEWNCKNARGKRVASGVYFLTVRHGGNTVSGKFIVTN